MKSVKRLQEKAVEERKQKEFENKIFDIVPPAIRAIEIIPDVDFPKAMCNYKDLVYIPNKDLIENNTYYYNSSICDIPNSDTYRLFYRVGKEPKGYEDKIATCLLDKNFEVLKDTNKFLNVYSNWRESMTNQEFVKLLGFYKFKDGEHVEDPRAVLFNGFWFVFYTDGIRIGVAKLDLDTCETIYSHYLYTPIDILHGESDGREKNWIPFVAENKLYILYSDIPRTIFECEDTENKLVISSIFRSKSVGKNWPYGAVRGGAPPCIYDNDHLIWFFHSQKAFESHVGYRIHYMIGAYVSKNTYPYDIVKISRLPLLIGIPAPASKTISYQHCVVFPCGAIKTDSGWKISMGVNDYETALLDVTEDHFLWKNL